MKILRKDACCIVAAVCLVTLALAAQSRPLYRYYDGDGKLVVDYQVPKEFMTKGYEVLNEKGHVIKVVPRKLTEEELQAVSLEKQREEDARKEQERLREWDESLLLRYSTVADIESTRERALGELRIRLTILKGNRRSLKSTVETYQSQAADMERRGQTVDVARLIAIENLQDEIAATDRAIADRNIEIDDISAAYQADIDRFELLLDAVKMRQAHRNE